MGTHELASQPHQAQGSLFGLQFYFSSCLFATEAGNVVSTPASTTTNTCPSGFTPYWYGCYKLITSTHTWKDAHSECTKLSADLVSIHSATENAAIFAKIASSSGDRIWIGLNDIEVVIVNAL